MNPKSGGSRTSILVVAIFSWVLLALAPPAGAVPPRLDIYQFDVNVGDSTLIVSPDGHGVLIDAGFRGRGANPVINFLERAKQDGRLESLDYVVATHYDADHIGGLYEVLSSEWYPKKAVLDRGNSLLPCFDRTMVQEKCEEVSNLDEAQDVAPWGTAPAASCPKPASCDLVEYLLAAEAGGKRRAIEAGDVLELDHGLEIHTLVANGVDVDGEEAEIHFSGRRDDCAANDLSVGLLLKFGDFRYLIAGDLTGDRSQKVAKVEELIADDARDVDVYHADHHGSKTSSEEEFMREVQPTVVVVSNGGSHGHPSKAVITDRILAADPAPEVYITNRNTDSRAWQPPANRVADANLDGFDGTIQIAVWRETYRVFRWRNGQVLSPGDRYEIKER